MRQYLTAAAFSLAVTLVLVGSSSALFFDFQDEGQLDDWEVLNDTGGEWEIADGVLRLTTPGARWDLIAIKGIEFTDGTIQFKLKWISGTYCEGGAAYRIQGGPDFANYQIHISTVEPAMRWGYCIAMDNGGQWGPDLPRPAVNNWGTQPVDEWFEFRIEVEGDNHTVDAGPEGQMEEVANVTEGELKSGRIGIVSYSGMAEEILFDDFEVNGPDIPSSPVDSRGKLSVTWGSIRNSY